MPKAYQDSSAPIRDFVTHGILKGSREADIAVLLQRENGATNDTSVSLDIAAIEIQASMDIMEELTSTKLGRTPSGDVRVFDDPITPRVPRMVKEDDGDSSEESDSDSKSNANSPTRQPPLLLSVPPKIRNGSRELDRTQRLAVGGQVVTLKDMELLQTSYEEHIGSLPKLVEPITPSNVSAASEGEQIELQMRKASRSSSEPMLTAAPPPPGQQQPTVNAGMERAPSHASARVKFTRVT